MSWRAVYVVASVLAALSSGCVVYDLEPVEPLAWSQREKEGRLYGTLHKANLFFAVDRSGSMNEPVSRALPGCAAPCGASGAPLCPASCPTRWTELRRALGDFVTRDAELARMGMALFPHPNAGSTLQQLCAGPDGYTSFEVPIPDTQDVPAELRDAAARIGARLAGTSPGGGTPTSSTLLTIAAYPSLTAMDQRVDVVVLLTDGLPNCNFANPASGASGCTCISPPCAGEAARAGCLDDAAAVRAVQVLKQRSVSTIVVGFGATVDNPDGARVLNAMAEAGGYARACNVDADCGAQDRCESAGLCARRFYQANTADELSGALDAIKKRLPTEPCAFKLDAAPSDEALLGVRVAGKVISRGPQTWRYEVVEGVPQISFQGALCEQIRGTDETAALPVEVRVVESY